MLEGHLGHSFGDLALLRAALTHRSFVNENPGAAPHNERLEFLGDAVLGLAISHLLMNACPERSEGELSALRARIVNEQSLAALASRIDLGQWLFLGRGEDLTGGRHKPSLLADACEAVIGAVYYDRGFDYTLGIIRRLFSEQVAEVVRIAQQDHKSTLQEWVQAHHRTRPRYVVIGEEGPGHDKTFDVAVWLDEKLLAQGRGKTKREASQRAAELALLALFAEDDRAHAASLSPSLPPAAEARADAAGNAAPAGRQSEAVGQPDLAPGGHSSSGSGLT